MSLNDNKNIELSKIKDLLPMVAMFLLTVENITDSIIDEKNISVLPMLVNFMVNSYEDGDKSITQVSIMGYLAILVVGIINNKFNEVGECLTAIEFFILGIITGGIFILYCMKLSGNNRVSRGIV